MSEGFWDDLLRETVYELVREPDAGNVDDGLSQRDQEFYQHLYPEPYPREDNE